MPNCSETRSFLVSAREGTMPAAVISAAALEVCRTRRRLITAFPFPRFRSDGFAQRHRVGDLNGLFQHLMNRTAPGNGAKLRYGFLVELTDKIDLALDDVA